MKIIHIIVGLGVGGAELTLKRLIEAHKDNPNYLHSVISLTTTGDVGQQLQTLGVEVHALGMRSALSIPFTLWKLIRLLSTEQRHIGRTCIYHVDFLGGLATRMAGNRNGVSGVKTINVNSRGASATTISTKCMHCNVASLFLTVISQ